MRTRILLIALAGTGLVATAPSLAQNPTGSADADARAARTLLAQSGGFDALRERTRGRRGATRARSRGNDNTPERAVEATSETAVEATTETNVAAEASTGVGGPEADAVPADLSGLEIGLTVRGADGVEIGTVERVNRSSDGTVRNVIVSRANGQGSMTMAPGNLSVSGGVVTTTSPQ